MAKSNVLVRVEADTKNYDANIAKARKQLEKFGEDNLSAGGILKQLSGNLIGVAAKFASFGAAAAAAMKVAKDAFFNNEQQLDDWGRTVKSAEGVYKGFLNSLNTGDISGFMSSIGQIMKAARDAYDALDELNTFNAFNQRNVARTRREMTESIVDFKEGKGSKESVRAAAESYKEQLKERQRLEMDAYDKAITELALQRGVSAADLRAAMSGAWGNYRELKNLPLSGTRKRMIGGSMTGYKQVVTENYAANEMERLGDALRRINDENELDKLQKLGAMADQTGDEIAQVDKQLTRVLNGRGGLSTSGGKGGGKNTPVPLEGSIDAQVALVDKLTKKWKAATDQVGRDGYLKQLEEAQRVLEKMMEKPINSPGISYGAGNLAGKGGSGLFQQPLFMEDTTLQTQQNLADMLGVTISKTPFKLDDKAMKSLGDEITRINGKTEVSLTKEVGNIAGGISGILNGIESLGIDLPDGMKDVVSGIQGVIGILTSISTIVTAIQTIAAADTLIPFARGGIAHAANGFVPGNRYSADDIPVAVSSGELILNRAQQGALASQLQNNQQRGPELARVSGEQIYVAMSNYLRRSGKGELITWR